MVRVAMSSAGLVDRRAAVGGVLGDVRGDAALAQLGDEGSGVVGLVAAERGPARDGLGQRERGVALGAAAGRGDAAGDDQAAAVLGEHVADVRQARLLLRALAVQPRVRVAGRAVGGVAPALPLEVAGGAGAAARGPVAPVAGLVAGPEALLPGPGLDERAVDAEVLVAEQLGPAGLGHDRGELSLGDLAVDQPVAVLAEGARVSHRVVEVEADEPAEVQVDVEPLHQEALGRRRSARRGVRHVLAGTDVDGAALVGT